jgi:hypothetical protein
MNNDKIETFEGNKKLFKIDLILKHLHCIFSILYKLKAIITLDESQFCGRADWDSSRTFP